MHQTTSVHMGSYAGTTEVKTDLRETASGNKFATVVMYDSTSTVELYFNDIESISRMRFALECIEREAIDAWTPERQLSPEQTTKLEINAQYGKKETTWHGTEEASNQS